MRETETRNVCPPFSADEGQTAADVALTPGEHQLTLQFADADQRSFGPEFERSVTVSELSACVVAVALCTVPNAFFNHLGWFVDIIRSSTLSYHRHMFRVVSVGETG
jgi:hypothetical protein